MTELYSDRIKGETRKRTKIKTSNEKQESWGKHVPQIKLLKRFHGVYHIEIKEG